jgi:hypothetical protein
MQRICKYTDCSTVVTNTLYCSQACRVAQRVHENRQIERVNCEICRRPTYLTRNTLRINIRKNRPNHCRTCQSARSKHNLIINSIERRY